MTVHVKPASSVKEINFGPRCLVTGGAGYIGRALTGGLLSRGYEVHILDVNPAFEGNGRVKNFTGDIRDSELVRRAVEGCGTVFHNIALIKTYSLNLMPAKLREELYQVNTVATRDLIEASIAAGVQRLIYTSTNSVVYAKKGVVRGDESRPYPEKFLDIYASSKAEAEQAVLSADTPGGMRTAAIRPAGVWGPGEGCYMLTKFIQELHRGRLTVKIGNGRAATDNTHIDNIVHAAFLAAEKLITGPETVAGNAYFITDNEPMNLMEWFSPFIEKLGYPAPKRSIPGWLVYFAAWVMEWIFRLGGPEPVMTRLEIHNLITNFWFVTDRARRDLGYVPLKQRDSGMEECLASCRRALAMLDDRVN